MSRPLNGSLDMLTAVVLLCRKAIVGAAKEAQVVRIGAAAFADGVPVIVFEPSAGSAAPPLLVHPAALQAITLYHGATSSVADALASGCSKIAAGPRWSWRVG
jgi:hypothetical protein